MSESSPAALHAALPEESVCSRRSRLSLFLELAKARLCAMVLVSTAVGFVLASPAALDWPLLLLTLLGTALAAFGANALNQCVEVARDARMQRTAQRPLPTRRLSPEQAWTFALATASGGPLLLAATVNVLAGGLALITALIYVLAYTPLKVRTPLNTLVGAIVGAIPPMIGWAGATGTLGIGSWLLGGVLFLWQIPHFLALAWLYRDDYARGGFAMLPAQDPTGRLTGTFAVLYSVALVPWALSLTAAGIAGVWFAAGAVLLGTGLVAAGVALRRQRRQQDARRLFLASVIYLPLLLGLMVFDRQPAAAPAPAARQYVALDVASPAANAAKLPPATEPQPLQ